MSRPNILLIHADQHRYDCLGCYGNTQIQTPAIDALASDGVVYRNSFCPYPICTPSRYSLLTGLYVNQHLGKYNGCTLPDGLPTFPKMLREHGYSTACVGKMHFAPTYLDVGFDHMMICEQVGPGRLDDDFHRELKRDGLFDWVDTIDQMDEHRKNAPEFYFKSLGALESDLPEERHSTRWIGDRACEVIENWNGGGNLLMAGFVKPHHPFDPPYPYSEMYKPEDMELLPGYTEVAVGRDTRGFSFFAREYHTEEAIRRCQAMYYGTISHIDAQVNRIINILKRKGLYDNCMVIYTSDHGDYMGYHHMIGKINYLYEPLAKVPLVVKYPGNACAGIVSEQMINNVDVTVTILGKAGLGKTHGMTGYDFSVPGSDAEYIFAEDDTGYMVRSRKYKLLYHNDKESLFFDLESDPFELTNLYDAPSHRMLVDEYRNILADWILFGCPRPLNLNEGAAVRAPNARAAENGHREEMLGFFARGAAEIPEKYHSDVKKLL